MEGVLMTGMANDASAYTYSQPVLPKHITQVTDQINFAPTTPAHKLVLKSWERQPSTAFLARHKSRKIWKRFRKSMEALRGRRIAAPQIEENEFLKEISQSANATYVRAVKRQRLRIIRESDDGDNNEEDANARGRSFLETKWELETGKRKRKMVALPEEEQLAAVAHGAENEAEGNHVALSSLEESPEFVVAVEAVDNGASEDDDADHGDATAAVISEIVDLAVDAQGSETVAEVRQLIAKQEPTLVRSALRMNSLDGDDAALLSEFLSRAQAKRAANAAMVSNESKSVMVQKKAKKMDKKKDEEEERHRQQQQAAAVTLSSPAIQSRRALEELDVNSPTIQKPSASTPVKADKSPESPSAPEPDEDALDQMSSPSVARRRSNRTKTPKAQQTRSLRPAVPNQIPVRRANGTEFVFLQRTDAQELALTTRKNTRRNKGNSVLPKYLLQALSKQERSDETTPSPHTEEKDEDHQPQPRRSPRKHAESKQVWWRDDKLVEFAPEKTFQALESPSPGKKASRRDKTKQDITTTTTHALPATPSKKVRRINMAAMSNSSNTTTTTDTNSAPINKPLAAGTPIAKRKKITPKAPRGSSTTTTTNNTSTTELPPSHSHPSKSASAAPADARTAPTTKQSSGVSGAVQKASGIPRSKSLAKAPASSSAGATPMVKRVRAKRAAV